MSGVQSVSVSISINITETDSNSNANSNSGSTQQAQRNPFLDPNGPFANLDLTAAQQQQISSIFSQAQQNSSGSTGSSGSNGQSSWSQILSQINAILTPQQQTTLQSDLQTLKSNRHHGGESSSQSNPLSQLDLTSAQQTQIGQIVSAAQTNGTSPSDELNQIDNVLTPTQQQQLISLLTPDASSSTSTASGNVISTTA
jgi:Spy/CpxP family protein refolding chaperone